MTTPEGVVLIGESDQITSALYQRVLRASFDVIVAGDAERVLQILEATSITVLVLEVAMFNLDWDRLALVSNLCATRGIQFVICSTHDERRRGVLLGAAAYLVKPTLPTTLMETIRLVIRERR
jgi:DNA-binding response OmpR family regulator